MPVQWAMVLTMAHLITAQVQLLEQYPTLEHLTTQATLALSATWVRLITTLAVQLANWPITITLLTTTAQLTA